MVTVGNDAGLVGDRGADRSLFDEIVRDIARRKVSSVRPANRGQANPHARCIPQRVLVVDELPLLGAGLRAVLADEPWVAACLVATSAGTAWQEAQQRSPELVLVSASLGGRSGFDLCRAFKNWMPHVKVVLLSAEVPVSAALAEKHGAAASLPKNMPLAEIVGAVKRVAEGAHVFPRDLRSATKRLSKRELDVLQQLALGLSNPEVAVLLNLSRWTVKQHASAVYRKLGVRNRAEAASRGQQLGLIA